MKACISMPCLLVRKANTLNMSLLPPTNGFWVFVSVTKFGDDPRDSPDAPPRAVFKAAIHHSRSHSGYTQSIAFLRTAEGP